MADSKASECVKVVVRCRPMSKTEISDSRVCVVNVDVASGTILLKSPSGDSVPKPFTFDSVYEQGSSQSLVFAETAQPIILSVLGGYNGTIFAYGQTGTGKTFTMEGVFENIELRGITPNSFHYIFDHIQTSTDQEFLVRAQYLEIYNEEVRDLLSKDPKNRLDIKENQDHGVYVKDLTTYVVKCAKEMENVLQMGKKNRSTGATAMNADSSRSHSIFTIVVEVSEVGADNEKHIRVGKLNLVDLAGSERQSKTLASGDRLKEATKINLSLSALGNVISALLDPKAQHVPYRDSKLTRLLQDSLGGNTKTVMVANLGPADYNYDETLSTLRFANRAKNIKNKPKINEDPKDAMLREFQEEIKRLKAQLEASGSAGGPAGAPGGAARVTVSEEMVEELKRQLEEQSKAEREGLEAEKQAAEQERQRIAAELAKRQAELDSERAAQDALNNELKAMESKLLSGGGENLAAIETAHEKSKLLADAQHELEERRRQKQQLEKELAATEEAQLMAEEKYASVQEEAQAKTKKLKKLWHKYQLSQQEVEDVQEEFQREREAMLETIRLLNRQLKFNKKALEGYIPSDAIRQLEQKAMWDPAAEDWKIARLELAGNNIKPSMRGKGPRRTTDNPNGNRRAKLLVDVRLEMPERTTRDYGPGLSPIGDGPEVDTMCFSFGMNSSNMYFPFNVNGSANGSDSVEGISPATDDEARSRLQSAGRRAEDDARTRQQSAGRRPDSASRKKLASRGSRREDNTKSPAPLPKEDEGVEQNFPKARGLVSSSRRFA